MAPTQNSRRSKLEQRLAHIGPAEFATDILKIGLAPYQAEILDKLQERHKVAVRGPHGLGKTTVAASAALWGLTTFGDDCKIITTASVWRQLSRYLWPEIRKWGLKLKAKLPTLEILLESARYGQAEAFAVASNKAELIEGAHAAKLLYIIDEAKVVPEATFDAIEGAFSAGDCYALAISTPGDRSGRFFDIHRHKAGFEDWWTRHVTVDEALAAGRISAEWVEARRRQWGESSPMFQARVLGEFPEQGSDTLVSLGWVDAAIERGLAWVDQELPDGEGVIGLDVARFGDDDSCAWPRKGRLALAPDVWHGNDTMQTTGRAKSMAERFGFKLNVDENGVGAGVQDRLKEQGVNATGIMVGGSPVDKEHFVDLRAEGFWALRQMFENGELDLMPSDHVDRLTGELTGLKYKMDSSGKIRIESKADIKKRGLPSPDVADALMMAYLRTEDAAAWIGWQAPQAGQRRTLTAGGAGWAQPTRLG